MSDTVNHIARAGLFDIKSAEVVGEVWSFDCYNYSIKVEVGPFTMDLEVPPERVRNIDPDDYDGPHNGDRVLVRLR
jgi:hypothetical protein